MQHLLHEKLHIVCTLKLALETKETTILYVVSSTPKNGQSTSSLTLTYKKPLINDAISLTRKTA